MRFSFQFWVSRSWACWTYPKNCLYECNASKTSTKGNPVFEDLWEQLTKLISPHTTYWVCSCQWCSVTCVKYRKTKELFMCLGYSTTNECFNNWNSCVIYCYARSISIYLSAFWKNGWIHVNISSAALTIKWRTALKSKKDFIISFVTEPTAWDC